MAVAFLSRLFSSGTAHKYAKFKSCRVMLLGNITALKVSKFAATPLGEELMAVHKSKPQPRMMLVTSVLGSFHDDSQVKAAATSWCP